MNSRRTARLTSRVTSRRTQLHCGCHCTADGNADTPVQLYSCGAAPTQLHAHLSSSRPAAAAPPLPPNPPMPAPAMPMPPMPPRPAMPPSAKPLPLAPGSPASRPAHDPIMGRQNGGHWCKDPPGTQHVATSACRIAREVVQLTWQADTGRIILTNVPQQHRKPTENTHYQ